MDHKDSKLRKKRFEQMLASLNESQRESVLSTANTLQILAGPGSGKTRVLTSRVAYFVIERRIPPKQIIVVTFTNKAANEMKNRLKHLIGAEQSDALLMGTFHALCCRILHLHASHVDLEPNFAVADVAASKDILNKLRSDPQIKITHFTRKQMKIGELDSRQLFTTFSHLIRDPGLVPLKVLYWIKCQAQPTCAPVCTVLRTLHNLPDDATRLSFLGLTYFGAIWGLISKAKNKGETCSTYSELYGKEFKTKDIAVLYKCYEAELKNLNLVDFDNLLIKTCELLRKKKDVLSNIKAILVDEYQDTNIVQYELVKLMTTQGKNKEVTIVGDPDQSIYGFRNAEPLNFKKMQNDFSDIGVLHMEQNYRSTGTILKAALHVITQDSSRFNKSLRTNNPDGLPIFLISTENEEAQAEFVAKEIQNVVNKSMGLISYKDIAVLMRMNFISRQFEKVFRRYKIPFTIFGGDRFFDRVEVKDILSYLNFAYNPKDSFSFNRIVNVPKRGVGAANLKKIMDKNAMDETDLLETIMNIGNSESLGPAIKKKLLEFGSICSTLNDMMTRQKSVAEIIRYLIERIKYKEHLIENYFEDHEARWSNIGELISLAQKTPTTDDSDDESDYISSDQGADSSSDKEKDSLQLIDLTNNADLPKTSNIIEFLEYCALCSNQKEMEEAEGGKVALGTLHSAKGLEWPCVFIATCNDEVIPHVKAVSPNEVAEECRLLYVGITRSKFLMYCVTPLRRDSWGTTLYQQKSKFLEGMAQSVYSSKPPVWNDQIRAMLSQTIRKKISVSLDGKQSYDDDSITSSTSKKMKFDGN